MKKVVGGGWRDAGEKAVLALFAATMLMSRTFASNSRPANRYFAHWSRADGIALVTATAILASITLAGYYLAVRTGKPRARELCGFLFVGAIGSGIIEVLPVVRQSQQLTQAIWLAMAVTLGWFCIRRRTRVIAATRSLCLTFSLLVPILFWQALTWSPFHTSIRPLNFPRPDSPQARPVFLFLFDEFSYLRATEKGEFRPELPNLRRLQSTSLMLENAQSEGCYTAVSVPRLLFEPSSGIVVSDGRITIEGTPVRQRSSESRSLFTIARDHGYNTSVVGVYLPYGKLFDSQLDSGIQRVWGPYADEFASKVGLFLVRQTRFLPDPLSSRLGRAKEKQLTEQAVYDLLRETHADSLAVVRSCPRNTFAYFHSPGTHPPLVSDSQGSFVRGHFSYSVSRYVEQMRYVDKLVGELVDTLKACGKYDDALIILCSDHSFKTEVDPAILATPGWMYHVPLVVKWPGQTKGITIDHPFSLSQMEIVVSAAMEGKSLEDVVSAIRRAPVPPKHTETGPIQVVSGEADNGH